MDCLWMYKWPVWEALKLGLFSLISDHRHDFWIHSAVHPDLSVVFQCRPTEDSHCSFRSQCSCPSAVPLRTVTAHPDLSAQYCSTEAGLAICSAIDWSWPSVFTPLISQLRSSIKSHGTYRKCMKQLYFVCDVFKMFGDTISHSYLGICPNHLFNLFVELSVLVSLYLLMINADVYVQTLL